MKRFMPYFILAIVALIIGNYFFAPKEIFFKNQCKLQAKGSCTLDHQDYRLIFTLSPLPISPLEPLHYEAQFIDLQENKKITEATVTLRILGHDMTMPEELLFPLVNGEDSKTSFEATKTFPTCTEKLMIWRLYLTATLPDSTILKTTFDLQVVKPKLKN